VASAISGRFLATERIKDGAATRPKSNWPPAMLCADAIDPNPRAISRSIPRAFIIPLARATKI